MQTKSSARLSPKFTMVEFQKDSSTAKDRWSCRMATRTKVTGRMTSDMEVASANSPTELFTKESGEKGARRAKAFCSVHQMRSSRAVLKAGSCKTEEWRSFSRMANFTKVIWKITVERAQEVQDTCTTPMETSTRANGLKTSVEASVEKLPNWMVLSSLANSLKMKLMALWSVKTKKEMCFRRSQISLLQRMWTIRNKSQFNPRAVGGL